MCIRDSKITDKDLHYARRQIRVSKVIVHENFNASVNDIALLKLGKKNLSDLHDQFSEERVDLSVFSPVCLPSNSASLVGQEGHIYGGQHKPL